MFRVKRALELLKTEVREDMMEAHTADSIKPFRPRRQKKHFLDCQLSGQAREGLDLLKKHFQIAITCAAFTRCGIPSTTLCDIYHWFVMGLSFPAECLQKSGSRSLSEGQSVSACISLTTALCDGCHCLCPSLEKSLLYKK